LQLFSSAHAAAQKIRAKSSATDLTELMNPAGRYYKLNLRALERQNTVR